MNLISGENQRDLCNGLSFAVAELRGDWMWFRDLFHFRCGWQNQEICYLCPCRSNNYMIFPSPLQRLPRRDLASFMSVCNEDSNGCKRASAVISVFEAFIGPLPYNILMPSVQTLTPNPQENPQKWRDTEKASMAPCKDDTCTQIKNMLCPKVLSQHCQISITH